MDEHIQGISYKGAIYSSTRTDKEFNVAVRDCFAEGLTNPLKTVDGTIGTMHRAHLHELLDEWIDNALKEKNDSQE